MRWKEGFDRDVGEIKKLKEAFPSVDFASAPGSAIFDGYSGLGEVSGQPLELLFPRNHHRDRSTVAQRIDVANTRVNSRLTRAFYLVGDLLVMHMADIITIITLSCAGMVIYWGGNLIWGATQILFCFLCMAEHKPFWMHPTYNDGLLCTTAAGRIFRWCCAFAQRFRTIRYFMNYINYEMFGKAWMCIDLVLYLVVRFFPKSFTSCWDSFIKLAQTALHRLSSVDTSIYIFDDLDARFNEKLEICKGGEFSVSEKLFVCFQCQDPRPDSSLRQLEVELLNLVEERLKPSCEAGECAGFKLENFYKLIWRDTGVFSDHVNACTKGRESFELDAKVVLYICISALQIRDTAPLQGLIGSDEDLLNSCPDLVKEVTGDLCLRLRAYSFHTTCERVCSLPLDEPHKDNDVLAFFQAKVLQISQQVRDRESKNLILRLSVSASRGLQWLSQIDYSVGQPLAQFVIDVCKEIVDFWRNVHFMRENMLPMFERDLGLITYSGGTYSDLVLEGPVSDSPLWNVIAVTCFKLLFGGFAKQLCAREVILELKQALQNEGDSRICLLDLYQAILELSTELQGSTLNLEFEEIVATFLSGNPNYDDYVRLKNEFIERYLRCVLAELGMVERIDGRGGS